MRTMFRHVTRAHRADRFLSLLLGVGLATGTGTTGALATEQASRTDARLLSVAEAENARSIQTRVCCRSRPSSAQTKP